MGKWSLEITFALTFSRTQQSASPLLMQQWKTHNKGLWVSLCISTKSKQEFRITRGHTWKQVLISLAKDTFLYGNIYLLYKYLMMAAVWFILPQTPRPKGRMVNFLQFSSLKEQPNSHSASCDLKERKFCRLSKEDHFSFRLLSEVWKRKSPGLRVISEKDML